MKPNTQRPENWGCPQTTSVVADPLSLSLSQDEEESNMHRIVHCGYHFVPPSRPFPAGESALFRYCKSPFSAASPTVSTGPPTGIYCFPPPETVGPHSGAYVVLSEFSPRLAGKD